MRQGENAMFEILDRRSSLTGNQIKILSAAIIGDALEFFDYFLIGFVLAFLIGPWKLTFGQSAVVLMSSGIGAIIGAYVWGWLADRIGRRTSGMGSAYGFGGIGKIIGPVGLALIVGSGNYLKPDVPLPQIPTAFVYLGCWFLMAGIVYYFLGIETKGKSIEQIDKELTATADLATATVRRA